MKKCITTAIIALLCISCETESVIVKSNAQDNLVLNEKLRQKLLRLSQFPTSADNIVDGTSCFALNLPAHVLVNNHEVALESESDYRQVRNLIEMSNTDTDVVSVIFPVEITYRDYTQASISNLAQWQNALSDCDDVQELSCMVLDYPITIKTYKGESGQTNAVTLGSKKALFDLLNDYDNYDTCSIEFPIQFYTPDATTIRVADATQLETLINNYSDSCLTGFEEPENEIQPQTALIAGVWHVSYYYRNTNQTADYAGYNFTFQSNGNITVNGIPGAGSWTISLQNGATYFDFSFSAHALDALEEYWEVTYHNATMIQMKHHSGGGNRYLNLSQN